MLVRVLEVASSPTARFYSLLFGGAYAPNDAIYRKRYAFTDALIKLLVLLGRVKKNRYQLFFPRLPATSTIKEQIAVWLSALLSLWCSDSNLSCNSKMRVRISHP